MGKGYGPIKIATKGTKDTPDNGLYTDGKTYGYTRQTYRPTIESENLLLLAASLADMRKMTRCRRSHS